MEQMFHYSHHQVNNWRCDNPHVFRNQVHCATPQTTSSGKVKYSVKCFSLYGSDDLSVKIEPRCRRHYKLSDVLAIRPMNSDETIDEDDYDDNLADHGAPSG